MAQQQKINKEFCITDDSVNCYEYRLLTSGFLLAEFKKNPIGYLMHNREKGIIVKWTDFRIDKDKVFAKPIINLSNPEAQKTISEIENGFLNAASCGKIVCLEASDDDKLKLPGQTKPTVTKWFPREISLVDIPGNYNAVANLVDENDNILNLSDFVNNKTKPVLNISSEITSLLNLKDNCTQEDFINSIKLLLNKSEALDFYIDNFINTAVLENKITASIGANIKNNFKNKPKDIVNLINSFSANEVPEDLKYKKWDDLYLSNDLDNIRKKYPMFYQQLRNEKFPNLS